MKDPHLNPEDFARVMTTYGNLKWQAAVEQHVHQVQGCPECTRRLLRHFELESLEELARWKDPQGELLRRSVQNRAAATVAWLESLPQKERLTAMRRDKKLRTQEILEGLLRRVQELRAAEPEKALALTELAVAILPRLVESEEDLQEPHDIAARVWAHHGNVLRILSDLHEADRAFRHAGKILASKPCEDLVQAEVLALEASLRRAQRRYEEAQQAIDEAIRIYGEWEEWHQQGHHLLARARILCELDQPEAALADLRRAVPLLAVEDDPRLTFVVASTELHLLCETARFDEAAAYVPHARALAEQHGSPADLLRVRWCEGRIAAMLGPASAAEAAFLEARRGFIDLGIGYEAALVSLDLAVLYAEHGRTAEIHALAQEMLAIFESRGVGTEAMAAAFLFCKAVWQEEASADALRSIRRRLKEARRL